VRPALLGISTLPPGNHKDSNFTDGKRTLFNASTAIENQTFGAGMAKTIFHERSDLALFILAVII